MFPPQLLSIQPLPCTPYNHCVRSLLSKSQPLKKMILSPSVPHDIDTLKWILIRPNLFFLDIRMAMSRLANYSIVNPDLVYRGHTGSIVRQVSQFLPSIGSSHTLFVSWELREERKKAETRWCVSLLPFILPFPPPPPPSHFIYLPTYFLFLLPSFPLFILSFLRRVKTRNLMILVCYQYVD